MKNYLLAVFLFSSFAAFDTAAVSQCYCSRKCGPREVMPDDRPTYDTITLPDGQTQEICFCKPWDRDNYVSRKCYKNKNGKFQSACDEQKVSKKKKKKSKKYEEPMRLRY